MKRTLSSAIKGLVEAQVSGVTVYRRRHPQDDPAARIYPYITVHEGISVVPDVSNPFDDSDTAGVFDQIQVDLWQRWKEQDEDEDEVVVEDVTLPDQIHSILHGGRLPLAPNRVYGMHVLNRTPLDDEDANIIRCAYTVQLTRTLARRV